MSYNLLFPYDISIVGLGMLGAHQITREAEACISRATRVFVADQVAGVPDYLKALNPQITDLTGHFQPEIHRVKTYRAIASEVVAAALEKAPVCYAAYGHPKVYSYPTILIQRAAAILDLRVKVLPGVSFLDTLFVDLGLDPGVDGLQMYEATDLLVRRRPLQTDVSCVISQAPFVLQSGGKSASLDWSPLMKLQEYLASFYPVTHEAVIVVSSTHPLLPPLIRRTKIGTLAAALANTPHSGTLYIPPVKLRPIADEAFAARMRPPVQAKPATE
jgi:precorrin-6B methylase 1